MNTPGFEATYAVQVAHVTRTIDTYVGALPPTLANMARHFCRNVVNHLAFQIYLPLWLGTAWRMKPETALKAALGNAYASMYFVIQDNATDSPGQSSASLLPLSNLFFGEFLSIYTGLAATGADFWYWYQSDLTEYGEAVTVELVDRYCRLLPFTPSDLDRLGSKIAPLKLSIRTLAGHAGCSEVGESLCRAAIIQEGGRQLADDLEDWRADLAAGNFTYPLVMAASALCVTNPCELTESAVAQALHTTGLAESILDASDERYNQALVSVKPFVSDWADYIQYRLRQNAASRRNLLTAKLSRMLRLP